ncbi:ribulokinase, partial [Klebsiella pneumoniae]
GSAVLGAVAGSVAVRCRRHEAVYSGGCTYHSETAFSPLHQRRYAAYKALQQAGRLIRE